jgi:hypothetical protein
MTNIKPTLVALAVSSFPNTPHNYYVIMDDPNISPQSSDKLVRGPEFDTKEEAEGFIKGWNAHKNEQDRLSRVPQLIK